MTQLANITRDDYGVAEPQQDRLPVYDQAEALLNIGFSEDDARRFHERLKSRFRASKTVMCDHHDRAVANHRKFHMFKPQIEKLYEGEPSVVTPITHDKVKELFGQMLSTYDQNRYWAHKGDSNYEKEVAAIREELMNELILSNARLKQDVISGALMLAIIEGTSFIYWELVRENDDELLEDTLNVQGVPRPKVVPLTDFFTDRLNVGDLSQSFVAIREISMLYEIEELAIDGSITENTLRNIRSQNGVNCADYNGAFKMWKNPEVSNGFNDYEDENKPVELFRFWIPYRRLDGEQGSRGDYYEGLYHEPTQTIVKIVENKYQSAFTGPPISPQRISYMPGHILGRGVVDEVDAYQVMADEALYTHIRKNQLAVDPPFLYDNLSSYSKYFQEKGITPGLAIPYQTGRNIDQQIKYLNFNNNGLALQDMQLAIGLSEKATFSADGGGGSRQSRGEFVARLQLANFKINLNKQQYDMDAAVIAEMGWALVSEFYIRPVGIVEVNLSAGYKLLGYEEVSPRDLFASVLEQASNDPNVFDRNSAAQYIASIYLGTDGADGLSSKLTEGYIPSCRDSGVEICLNGDRGIQDKIIEAQKYERALALLPGIVQLNPDDGLWQAYKKYMEANGMDWRSLIGTDPTGKFEGEWIEQFQQQLAVAESVSSNVASASTI